MRLHHVTDPGPSRVADTIARACAARGVEHVRHVAPDATVEPVPGDLLFRSGGSAVAWRLEQTLQRPGVASFYLHPAGAHVRHTGTAAALEAAGVPAPRSVPSPSPDPARLEAQVAHLGGYPVVLKVHGSSNGVGVLQVDTPAALRATLRWLWSVPYGPTLMERFPLVRAHRLIVVGDRVVFGYAKVPSPDDFRTNAAESADDVVHEPVEARLEAVAVAATRALELAHGGVDVLEADDGRLVVTEVNFPCDFVRPETVFGADIAGPMVDWLVARARAA